MPRLLTLGAVLVFAAAACAGPGKSTAPTGAAGTPAAGTPAAGTPAASTTGPTAATAQAWTPDATRLAAAKAEGALTLIAVPRDWCNYGAIIDDYTAKTGIPIKVITPLAGSGAEIEAIKTSTGAQTTPDVVDVGIPFGPSNKALFMPYKVATWDTIAAADKDPDGAWAVDYYGVLSFEVNKAFVTDIPQDWNDLLKPGMKVALAGDPTLSSQAIQSVFAAALSQPGGSLDNAQPGLDFFKKLNDAGNFVPTIAKLGSVVKGDTPIVITWSYLALADRDASKADGSADIQVVIPKTGRFAGKYVQAIAKVAPHPNAAMLWEDLLFSDEGQIMWLTPPGYCTTARFADLKTRNVVPADVLSKLPDVAGAVFPTGPQGDAAKALIVGSWKSVTGVGPLATPAP
jgi:putative spermidine/putrescine transport system substrate-binding protein